MDVLCEQIIRKLLSNISIIIDKTDDAMEEVQVLLNKNDIDLNLDLKMTN